MAIDDPIVLSELLDVTDIDDIVKSAVSLYGISVLVQENSGDCLCNNVTDEHERNELLDAIARTRSGNADEPGSTVPVVVLGLAHHGANLGWIAVSPRNGASHPEETPEHLQAIARHLTKIFDVLVHNAFTRHVTVAVHDEAMKANFAELEARNRRLEKAVERLQEAERLKASFLATMSHELRTPLTSVIGYSEMLLEGLAGAVSKEQRDYLKTILSKADQLLQLITSILDVSMLEAGTPEIRREPVAIRDLVDSVLTSLDDRLKERQVTVTEARPNVPRVVGDRAQLREILKQLLDNAVKFTSQGERIDIELGVGPMQPDHVTPHGQAGVRIVVQDSGIGISSEQQANIFEPFYQADSSSTRQYGGSGLGLTLAKRYVEAHGGRIWVNSTSGKGSAFTVALPAVADDMRAFLGRYRKT